LQAGGTARDGGDRTDMTKEESLLFTLSEFIADRSEEIRSGAYEIEIANVADGDILELTSFGVSISGGGKFKISIDLSYGSI